MMRMVVDDTVLMVKRIVVNHGDFDGDENDGCGDEDETILMVMKMTAVVMKIKL